MQYACNNCGFGKPLFYQAHGKLKPSETKMTKGIHEGPETPQNCPVCHSTDLDLCLEGHDHKCRRGTVMGRCGRCGVDEPCFSSTAKSEPQEALEENTGVIVQPGAPITLNGKHIGNVPTSYPVKPQEYILTVVEKEIKHIIERGIRDALQSK